MQFNDTSSAAQKQTDSPGGKLGYHFEVLPTTAFDMICAKQLDPFDGILLMALIRFRRPPLGDWAWASTSTLEGILNVSDKTIRRASQRLVDAGLVEHHQVPIPDPDCPANRTGWRWRFLWIGQVGAPPPRVGVVQACTPPKRGRGPLVAPLPRMVGAPPPNLVGVPLPPAGGNIERSYPERTKSESVSQADGRTDSSFSLSQERPQEPPGATIRPKPCDPPPEEPEPQGEEWEPRPDVLELSIELAYTTFGPDLYDHLVGLWDNDRDSIRGDYRLLACAIHQAHAKRDGIRTSAWRYIEGIWDRLQGGEPPHEHARLAVDKAIAERQAQREAREKEAREKAILRAEAMDREKFQQRTKNALYDAIRLANRPNMDLDPVIAGLRKQVEAGNAEFGLTPFQIADRAAWFDAAAAEFRADEEARRQHRVNPRDWRKNARELAARSTTTP